MQEQFLVNSVVYPFAGLLAVSMLGMGLFGSVQRGLWLFLSMLTGQTVGGIIWAGVGFFYMWQEVGESFRIFLLPLSVLGIFAGFAFTALRFERRHR